LSGCYFYIIAEYRAASFDYLRRWVGARRALRELRRIERTTAIPRERGPYLKKPRSIFSALSMPRGLACQNAYIFEYHRHRTFIGMRPGGGPGVAADEGNRRWGWRAVHKMRAAKADGRVDGDSLCLKTTGRV
jgi:hypothetical protein